MLSKINPASTTAWHMLQQHYREMKTIHLKEIFREGGDRFEKFSLSTPDIIWDYSKNIITDKTVELLLQLADECELQSAIESMFNGEKINETEGRAVLHTALRNFSVKPVMFDGKDVMPGIQQVREQMQTFCKKVHNGDWKGYTGKKK